MILDCAWHEAKGIIPIGHAICKKRIIHELGIFSIDKSLYPLAKTPFYT